mmetsp:Transcript_76425/g.181792  ORF Transcript_76425/g.181792 Transcript_76425/m.181792 type:complete len:769 (+) Transcript_76425:28-2334(+)
MSLTSKAAGDAFSPEPRERADKTWGNNNNAQTTNFVVGNKPADERSLLLKFFTAADHGDVVSIDETLEEGVGIDTQDEEGRTALVMAVRNGHTHVVEALLRRGADIELATKHGATPLGLASWRGFVDIMQLLITARANLEEQAGVANRTNVRPAILWAAERGQYDAMKLLLQSTANPYGSNSNASAFPSPLVQAARHGHGSVVELLSEWGVKADCPQGGEALTLSARYGHDPVCGLLLGLRASPHYTDAKGVSPLMWASSRGHLECAERIMAAKAPVDARTTDGRTSLMLAARRGHRDVVKALMDFGASLYIPLQELTRSGDVERLASAISTGVSMMRGIPLAAFGRKMSPRTAALILSRGGHIAQQFLCGIFEEEEVVAEGSHAVSNLTLAYMDSYLHVAVDPLKAEDDGIWLLPMNNKTFAPLHPLPWYRYAHKVDVRFLRCVLPRVWDVEILRAISTAPGVEIFEGPYAESIIRYCWKEVWKFHAWTLLLEVSAVVCLGWLAVHMSDDFLSEDQDVKDIPLLGKISLQTSWSLLIPYACCSWAVIYKRGFASLSQLTKFAGRTIGVVALLWCVWDFDRFQLPNAFRALAAVVSAIEWVNFLDSLTAFSLVGPAMLPILTAMKDIWVMAAVLVLVLMACIHAHVLLTRVPIGESYLIIWVLGLQGDFEMDEFSGTGGWDAHFDAPIKGLLLIISFGVNLVLMNIFIGVVGNSYNDALVTAKADFLRKRAHICVMHKLGPLWQFMSAALEDTTTGLLWVCAVKDESI